VVGGGGLDNGTMQTARDTITERINQAGILQLVLNNLHKFHRQLFSPRNVVNFAAIAPCILLDPGQEIPYQYVIQSFISVLINWILYQATSARSHRQTTSFISGVQLRCHESGMRALYYQSFILLFPGNARARHLPMRKVMKWKALRIRSRNDKTLLYLWKED
jgi:hypothetical protein